MKILFLIVARGGSKRLKNKNIKILGNKPLIEWTISHAKKLTKIDNIVVSTDDQRVQEISKKAGVLCPWLRPKELATDDAATIDVAIHAIKWFESKFYKLDGVFLLQPTSPFRDINKTSEALEIFRKQRKSVVSVTNFESKDKNTYMIKNNYLEKIDKTEQHKKNDSLYYISGSFYISTIQNLIKRRSFFSKDTIPFMINSPSESIDIDYIEDFYEAEKYV